MADLQPSDHLRCEVAFTTTPSDPAPAYEDLTSRAVLQAGVSIQRGRLDLHDVVQPGNMTLTLDNIDGALTPDNTGSAFYPNVLAQRVCRLTYRDPASLALFNMVPAATADVEDGLLTNWWNNFVGATTTSTITSSTVRAFSGTKSVLVTWPTTAGSVGAGIFLPTHSLVKGRKYVASIPVYVPTGSPAVNWGDVFGGTPSVTSTAFDRWQILKVSFTATSFDVFLGLKPSTNPTAGQQVWADAVQVDEAIGTEPATSLDSGRLNYCPNPNFELDAANWAAYTGVAAPTRVTTTPFSGAGRLEAIGNNTSTAPRVAQTLTGFVVGDTWTLQGKVRQDGTFPTGGTAIAALRWQLAAGGETVQNATPAFVPASNGYMLLTLTGTVPAGANGTLVINLGFAGLASNLTAAGTIGVDEVLLEKAGSAGTYFDGSSIDDHPAFALTGAGGYGALVAATITTSVSWNGRIDWTRIAAPTPLDGARVNYPARSMSSSKAYTVALEVGNDTGTDLSLVLDMCDGTTASILVRAGQDKITSVTLTPGANADVIPGTYRFLDLAISATGSLLVRNVTVTPVAASFNVWTAGSNASTSQQFVTPFTTAAPPILPQLTGFVEEWPVEWPTGDDTYAWSMITVFDQLTRLARRDDLASVVEETVQLDNPLAYYTLAEAAGSTSAGDVSGNQGNGALVPTQVGVGGTLAFAAGTGPATDGHAAPMFTPASSANGVCLTGTVQTAGGWFSTDVAMEIAFAAPSAAKSSIARAGDIYGSFSELGLDAGGHLTGVVHDVWTNTDLMSLTSAAVASGGATHEAALRLTYAAGTVTGTLVLDGVSVATGSYSAPWTPVTSSITLGGTASTGMFSGTLSHFSWYGNAPSVARCLEHYTAMSTGFSGELSGARINRIASWCGIPANQLLLDAGSSAIAHVDCAGMNPLDYMHSVEATEFGLLFVDTSGRLVFYGRGRGYTPTLPSASFPSSLLDATTRPAKNLQNVINDITGTRPGGPTVRVVDATSKGTYGRFAGSLDLLLTTDSALIDALNWRLGEGSQPITRIPNLTLDGYTDSAYASAVRAIDISAHIQLTNMPAQAATPTIDQTVQGYRLQIAPGTWDMTANTTNYSTAVAFIVEDPVYGTLDGPGVLVY